MNKRGQEFGVFIICVIFLTLFTILVIMADSRDARTFCLNNGFEGSTQLDFGGFKCYNYTVMPDGSKWKSNTFGKFYFKDIRAGVVSE